MINTSIGKLPPGWTLEDSAEKNEFVLDGTNKTVTYKVNNPNYNPDKENPEDIKKSAPDNAEKKDAQDKLNMIMSQEEAKPKEKRNKEMIDAVKESVEKFKNSPQSMDDIKELKNNLDKALKDASDKADGKKSEDPKDKIVGNPEALDKKDQNSLASKFLNKADKPEFKGETDKKEESTKEPQETNASDNKTKSEAGKKSGGMGSGGSKEEKSKKDNENTSNAVGQGDTGKKEADKKEADKKEADKKDSDKKEEKKEKKKYDLNEKDYKKRPAAKIVLTPNSDKMMTYDENGDPIDGKWSKLDTPPQMINDRFYMPIRSIAEAMGLDVDWRQDTKEAVIDMGDGRKAVINTKDNTYYYETISGMKSERKKLDPPCVMKDVKGGNRTMLSMRALGNVMGLSVSDDGTNADIMWNNDRKTLTIGRENLGKKFKKEEKAKRNNEIAAQDKELSQIGLKSKYNLYELNKMLSDKSEINGMNIEADKDRKTFRITDKNGREYFYIKDKEGNYNYNDMTLRQ